MIRLTRRAFAALVVRVGVTGVAGTAWAGGSRPLPPDPIFTVGQRVAIPLSDVTQYRRFGIVLDQVDDQVRVEVGSVDDPRARCVVRLAYAADRLARLNRRLV